MTPHNGSGSMLLVLLNVVASSKDACVFLLSCDEFFFGAMSRYDIIMTKNLVYFKNIFFIMSSGMSS